MKDYEDERTAEITTLLYRPMYWIAVTITLLLGIGLTFVPDARNGAIALIAVILLSMMGMFFLDKRTIIDEFTAKKLGTIYYRVLFLTVGVGTILFVLFAEGIWKDLWILPLAIGTGLSGFYLFAQQIRLKTHPKQHYIQFFMVFGISFVVTMLLLRLF